MKGMAFVLGALLLAAGSSFAYADAVEDKIHATLDEISRLGSQPALSEEDRQKMVSLYAQMKDYGLNAIPVLQSVLESKDNVIKKKASLYVVQSIFEPKSVEEVDFKHGRAIKHYQTAAKDPSLDVRALALNLIASTNTLETFQSLRDIYETDPDPRLRVAALSRIAYYRMEATEQVLAAASKDPDASVQAAALQYIASRAADMERYNAENPAPKPDPATIKKYGKNA